MTNFVLFNFFIPPDTGIQNGLSLLSRKGRVDQEQEKEGTKLLLLLLAKLKLK